ncbi:MAG: penicillin-binding protein [Chloroflexota bacterium]|nr:MAG: penicillin-binding protein [Chloroflexota bacterium]
MVIWRFLLFCIVGIAVTACSMQAQNTPAELAQSPVDDWRAAIDAHVIEQMQQLGIPGAAVGIVRGDQVEYLQGYGIAGDDGRPVTPQTPFYIASLSKSVTAAAVIQLVEASKLELDAPVQRYLPWFRLADEEAAAQITVRHLLAQTSGFSELGGYERNLDDDMYDDALEQSVRAMHGAPLNAAPGVQFEYSNTNYDLLGLLVATVSSESYESYVQRHIFDLLDMDDAFTSLADAQGHGVSSGYYPYFGQVRSQDHAMFFGRATTPSAGLVASAEDLAHWLVAHLNGGRYADAQLISPQGMELLHTVAVSITEEVGYAMGWTTFPFTDALPADDVERSAPLALTHSGRWLGYAAQLLLVPEQELGVVLLLNLNDPAADSALSNIGWNVGLLALGLPAKQFPQHEDWVERNARLLMLAIVAIFTALNLWLLRPRARLVFIVAACLVQVVTVAYLVLIRLPEVKTTLPLLLRFEPDLGQITLVLIALAGWSVVRTGAALAQTIIARDRVALDAQ